MVYISVSPSNGGKAVLFSDEWKAEKARYSRRLVALPGGRIQNSHGSYPIDF